MLFWTKEEYEKFAESIKSKPASYYAFEILYWCGIREAVIAQGLFTKMILKVSKKRCKANCFFYQNLEKKFLTILSMR